jgi:hypothetical protein
LENFQPNLLIFNLLGLGRRVKKSSLHSFYSLQGNERHTFVSCLSQFVYLFILIDPRLQTRPLQKHLPLTHLLVPLEHGVVDSPYDSRAGQSLHLAFLPLIPHVCRANFRPQSPRTIHKWRDFKRNCCCSDKWEYSVRVAEGDGYYWRCVWHCAHSTVSPPLPPRSLLSLFGAWAKTW